MFQQGTAPMTAESSLFLFRDSKGIMPTSNLDDRIRLLTDRAIATKSQSELDAILPELKAAIRGHIRGVRDIAVATIPEAFGKSNAA
jgi:hypothetical protein